ncbi:anti-sigma factor family protein [Paenibacillus sedimenti]|uniref:Anti-sigma-W factor RsiW n=1 Tax=Paenibacillus sedimenti TaxID=2770274 RepID=A0A926QI78_9BACL|nr:zf-HC2 domain-containing protein [Paenibacillus sedimenti]MBD0379062.1 zf-HC2 domain-containing protein [Paenibacillus sedimenti]
MNCQEVMELMQRQLDGDLLAQEEEELEAHLMHCLECAEMFERLQRLSDELAGLPKVVPPYSLVDAILPQLGEIDRHAAASITDPATAFSTQAPSLAAGQPTKLPWTRRFGSQFSWKFAGGVVAAGLIIGFFAFNMKHPVLDQADGLLQPRTKSESSAAAQNAPAAGTTSGGAADRKTMMDDGNSASKAAPATSEMNRESTPPADIPSPQATTDAKLEKPMALDQSGSPKSTPSDPASRMTPATTEPERMKDPQSPGASEKNNPAAKPAEPTDSNQNKANTTQDEPKDMNTLKADEPSPSPVAKMSDPQENIGNRNGIFSFTAQPDHPLKSATGAYEAVIEQRHVVIRDSSSQEIVFTSKQEWSESDELKLVEWSTDDKLTYQVTSGDTSKSFVIDVKAKTEISP